MAGASSLVAQDMLGAVLQEVDAAALCQLKAVSMALSKSARREQFRRLCRTSGQPESVALLSFMLPGAASVRSFSLAGRYIGAKGTIALAAMLNETQITNLNLGHIQLCRNREGGITTKGITALCKGLKGSAVTSLSLHGNRIGEHTTDGITALCEGLKGSSLTSLSLQYNHLDGQAKQAIQDAAGSGVDIDF